MLQTSKKIRPFHEGQKAWNNHIIYGQNPKNPYKEKTKSWFEWNRGWSTNFKGIK